MAVVAAGVAAAGAASAADLPYRHHVPQDRIVYAPRGPVPLAVYAPPYRVIYQVPSSDCATNDFCSAAL